MLIPKPISEIEVDDLPDPQKSFLTWTQPITTFVPDTDVTDARVYCYARSSSFEKVIEAIRNELTKRLLNLLPKIE